MSYFGKRRVLSILTLCLLVVISVWTLWVHYRGDEFDYWYKKGFGVNGFLDLWPQMNPGAFTRALESWTPADGNDKKALAYHYRGEAYADQGDWGAAVSDYTKAIELNPKDIDSYHWRGLAHSALKEYDLAIKDITKSIELNGSYREYSSRAFVFDEKGEPNKALQDYTKCIELDPEDPTCREGRAKIYDKLANFNAAINDYIVAIQHGDATSNSQALAQDYDRIGQHDKALQARTGAPVAQYMGAEGTSLRTQDNKVLVSKVQRQSVYGKGQWEAGEAAEGFFLLNLHTNELQMAKSRGELCDLLTKHGITGRRFSSILSLRDFVLKTGLFFTLPFLSFLVYFHRKQPFDESPLKKFQRVVESPSFFFASFLTSIALSLLVQNIYANNGSYAMTFAWMIFGSVLGLFSIGLPFWLSKYVILGIIVTIQKLKPSATFASQFLQVQAISIIWIILLSFVVHFHGLYVLNNMLKIC